MAQPKWILGDMLRAGTIYNHSGNAITTSPKVNTEDGRVGGVELNK